MRARYKDGSDVEHGTICVDDEPLRKARDAIIAAADAEPAHLALLEALIEAKVNHMLAEREIARIR